jgi:hypothetical protein
MTLTAISALTLVFANLNVVFADQYKSSDQQIVDVLEKKEARKAKDLVATLTKYQQTLKTHDFANKAIEKRVNENTMSTENKISQIIEMLKNGKIKYEESQNVPTIDVLQVHKVRSGSPGGEDVTRVIYRVYSDSLLKDAKIVVDTQNGKVENILESSSYKVFNAHSLCKG